MDIVVCCVCTYVCSVNSIAPAHAISMTTSAMFINTQNCIVIAASSVCSQLLSPLELHI